MAEEEKDVVAYIPVSTASFQRSFWDLKGSKTYVRNTTIHRATESNLSMGLKRTDKQFNGVLMSSLLQTMYSEWTFILRLIPYIPLVKCITG